MTVPNTLLRDALDVTGASAVEVQIRQDGKVLWVNVDGFCALRVCRIDNLTVEDNRPSKVPDSMREA